MQPVFVCIAPSAMRSDTGRFERDRFGYTALAVRGLCCTGACNLHGYFTCCIGRGLVLRRTGHLVCRGKSEFNVGVGRVTSNTHEAGQHAIPTAKAVFRPDIQGLRAVAILLVIAFHVGVPGFKGGFVGVDIFFVVSGYLITGLFRDELHATGALDIVGFYLRRVRRLLPAAATVLVATLAAASFLLSPRELALYSRTAIAASLQVSNVWFQRRASDYFAFDAGENPFLHTWSLSVEEQFYLVWPLLLAATFRLFGSAKRIPIAIFITVLASFLASVWLVDSNPQSAFFSFFSRAWEFGVGGLAAFVPKGIVDRFSRTARYSGLVALLALVATPLAFDASTPFPGARALAPVLATAAVLVAGTVVPDNLARRILAVEPLQQLGRFSYSWYLWHWPTLVLGAALGYSVELSARLVLVLLALAAAVLGYYAIEAPIRSSRYWAASSLRTFGLGAAFMVTAFGGSWAAKAWAAKMAGAPEQQSIEAAHEPVAPELLSSGCFFDQWTTKLNECAFGDKAGRTTIVLFGDSHAAQWFTAFDAAARERGWRLIVLTKMGCPTPDIEISFWTRRGRKYTECSVWRQSALSRIVALKPALVVISNSDNHITSPKGGSSPRLSRQQWQEGTRKTLTVLSNAGIRTVLLRDTPGPGIDVPTCLARAAVRHLSVEHCEAPRSSAIREDVFEATRTAVADMPRVTTIDLTDSFCSRAGCPAVIDGCIVYGQPGHIAYRFARTLADLVGRRIAAAMW